jgi:hypothetical protein
MALSSYLVQLISTRERVQGALDGVRRGHVVPRPGPPELAALAHHAGRVAERGRPQRAAQHVLGVTYRRGR